MPLALDRNELCPVCLRSDEDKPEAERPVFLFYHLTRREVRQVEELIRQARECKTDEEFEPMLNRIIGIGLAGWRNMRGRDGEEIPYSPGSVDMVLTSDEMIELAGKYPYEVAALGAKKKRESTSPLPPDSAPSAPAAAPGAAIPPPNGHPSSSAESPALIAAEAAA